jgi:hypothetical protein
VLSVRPKIAELSFQLFGRSLHPELFDVHKTMSVERNGYQVRIDITNAGHVISWQRHGLVLTEVCCSAQHPLPQKRRLLSYRLKGERNDRVECRGGVAYDMNFSLEPVGIDAFWSFQDQMSQHAAPSSALLHVFDASGRMALGAISFINVEARNRSLTIQAFHTFPDDCAIVKTRSVIELP